MAPVRRARRPSSRRPRRARTRRCRSRPPRRAPAAAPRSTAGGTSATRCPGTSDRVRAARPRRGRAAGPRRRPRRVAARPAHQDVVARQPEDVARRGQVEGDDTRRTRARRLSAFLRTMAFLPLARKPPRATMPAMRIEIPLYDDFDEVDAIGPFEVLANAAVAPGLEVELVGAHGPGEIVAGHGLRFVLRGGPQRRGRPGDRPRRRLGPRRRRPRRSTRTAALAEAPARAPRRRRRDGLRLHRRHPARPGRHPRRPAGDDPPRRARPPARRSAPTSTARRASSTTAT